jgi:hypothetical protein
MQPTIREKGTLSRFHEKDSWYLRKISHLQHLLHQGRSCPLSSLNTIYYQYYLEFPVICEYFFEFTQNNREILLRNQMFRQFCHDIEWDGLKVIEFRPPNKKPDLNGINFAKKILRVGNMQSNSYTTHNSVSNSILDHQFDYAVW